MNDTLLAVKSKSYRIVIILCVVAVPFAMTAHFAFELITEVQCLAIILACVIILGLGIIIIRANMIYAKQEKELRMYRTYVNPMEELIREVRARQHEFDNHLNCILNMHVTIDNYDELVKKQSEYILGIADDRKNSFVPLLKLSNKVLAAFVYTKIVSVRKDVSFEIEVGSRQIPSNVPDRDMVEIVGTLIDNAVEACYEDNNQISISIGEEDEKLLFIVRNKHDKIPLSRLGEFFLKGYSTKTTTGKRGLGLYNAKKLVKKWKGEIFVHNEEIEGKNYICFGVKM